ncbi:MAG: cytidine deaminase [Bacteroidetes bacterium]|nr:cytidine deaminase [Bacteroidota bacterium]
MKEKEIKTVFYEYNSLTDLPSEEIRLVEKARQAAKTAYTPYSHFNVGASVLLATGEIIEGSNQENAAYPSGLCAERVALFYASSHFPEIPMRTIAITAYAKNGFLKDPVPPCGSCRQVMIEIESRFNSPIKVILSGRKKIWVIVSAKQLLPLVFDQTILLRR